MGPRLEHQAIDQCDAEYKKGDEKAPAKVASDDGKSDDDIPDLESISSYDDEQGPFRPIRVTNLIPAPASAIYDMDKVKCTTFLDDFLPAVKETDQILQLCQILQGPVVPDPEIMEIWAATDGGASSAFNRHEAIDRWETFSKQKKRECAFAYDIHAQSWIFLLPL